MRFQAGQCVVTVAILLVSTVLSSDVFVETEHGLVKGTSITAKPGPNSPSVVVNTFFALPYAKGPIGPLRWKPPVKPEKYKGVLDATRLGPACPQDGGIFLMTHPFWGRYSEDCLHLNVFAPNKTGSYPVLFWIHGGGYGSSANIQYPGHYLAAMDTVVVVINYRIGIYGFLTTEDSAAPGNYGLLDQNLALQWVQTNIRNFGGDPDKVTIFGQSAGGASAGLHIVSPKSKGLFHQAILQSGTDLTPWAINFPAMKPIQFTIATAKKLNCTRNTNQEMVDCLREVESEKLRQNAVSSMPLGYISLGFTPTVDHDFLPDEPEKLRAQGKFNKVKTMAGITSDDGSLYVMFWVPKLMERGFNRTEYVAELRKWGNQLMPEFKDVAYHAADFEYTHWPYTDDLELNRQSFVQMFTDVGMGSGTEKFLRSHAPHDSTYQFLMGYRSTNTSQAYPEWMGVPHNGELPFMFCYPCNLMPENDPIFYQMEMKPFSIVDWNHEDMEYSEFVLKLWTNFAKYGDPTPNPVKPPFNQPPVKWQQFIHGDKTNFMLFNRDYNELRHDYNYHRIAFWNHFVPNMYKVLKEYHPTNPPPTNPRIPTTKKPTNHAHKSEHLSRSVLILLVVSMFFSKY